MQMLTVALKKVHLTSVAVQTGKRTAEVATQTNLKDISPQGSTPGKKSNRKCYKCNGNHLKKNCPFKQVVQPGQVKESNKTLTLMQDEEMLSAEDILRDLNSQMKEDQRQEEREIQEFQNQTWDLLQQQQIEELEVNFHVTCDDLNMYNSEEELVF